MTFAPSVPHPWETMELNTQIEVEGDVRKQVFIHQNLKHKQFLVKWTSDPDQTIIKRVV